MDHRISYVRIGMDNDFSAMMRGLASDFNKAVCMIDTGGSEPLSYYYADMAEELVKRVKAVMSEKTKHQRSHRQLSMFEDDLKLF